MNLYLHVLNAAFSLEPEKRIYSVLLSQINHLFSEKIKIYSFPNEIGITEASKGVDIMETAFIFDISFVTSF